MRRASTWALLAVAVWLTVSALAQEGAITGRVVDTGGELEGATALACTFHPDGVIDNCRRVGVRGEGFPTP